MPVYNVTVDDSSPLFRYLGTWQDPADEVETALNGTAHSTTATDAKLSIYFQGTDIYLYGSKGTQHGHFQVNIDNLSSQEFDAWSQVNKSQAFLASWAVSPGPYMLELNANNNATETAHGAVKFDIDYAIITAGDNNPSTLSHDFILDDSSPNITYTSTFINCKNDLLSQYFNATMHCCGVFDGSAAIHFYGNAIAVYGATSSNHGAYLVSMDGTPPQMLNGSAPTFRPQSLLFMQSGLETDYHVLNLTNYSPHFFDLDYAVVSVWDGFASHTYPSKHDTQIGPFATADPVASASSTAGPSLPGPNSTAASQSAAHSTNSGAIAGGVVGGLLVLFAFGVVLFLLIRRLRSEQAAYRAERGWLRPAAWDGRNKSTPATAHHAPLPRWHRQSQVATQ